MSTPKIKPLDESVVSAMEKSIEATTLRMAAKDADVSTSAQRCLAVLNDLVLCKAISAELPERRIVRLLNETKALKAGVREVERTWEILRHALRGNESAGGVLDDIKHGRYQTGEAAYTRWVEAASAAGAVTPSRGGAVAKKVGELVASVAKDRSLVTDGQKSLKFIERLVQNKVLSLEHLSARAALRTVVGSLGPLGVRELEFRGCWLLVKGVAAGRYPKHELEGVRDGVSPSAASAHQRVQHKPTKTPDKQDKPKTSVRLRRSSVTRATRPATVDQLGVLSSILASAAISIESVIVAAAGSNDAEVARVASEAKNKVFDSKAQVSRLLMSRAEACAATTSTRRKKS